MSRRRRGAGRIPVVLSWGCALALGLACAIRAWLGEGQWVGCLVVLAPQWVWSMGPVALAVWTGLTRRFGLLALNCAALMVAAAGLGSFALATGSEPLACEQALALRVVSWNVCGHRTWPRAGEVHAALDAMDADIVCLQEANFPAFVSTASPYGAASQDMRVFSRFPVTLLDASRMTDDTSRGMSLYRVDTPSGPLALINVHFRVTLDGSQPLLPELPGLPEYLETSSLLRARQVQRVLDCLPPDLPVVVCGDMNLPPTSTLYHQLATRLTDAFAATRFGYGLTYLVERRVPSWRIDYVWCGEGVRPLRTFTGPPVLSDHRPIVADLLVAG